MEREYDPDQHNVFKSKHPFDFTSPGFNLLSLATNLSLSDREPGKT